MTGGMLAAALAYAEHGRHVFPLAAGGKLPALPTAHPEGDPARATCKGTCGRQGHGLNDATTDPDVITSWWSPHPAWNVGVACGPSGLVVIDLDTDPDPRPARVLREQDDAEPTPDEVRDGPAVLRWLAERRGGAIEDLRTRTVATPSGGWHLLYTAAADVQVTSGAGMTSGLGWCVDVRAAGGYVVAPPSVRGGTGWRVARDAPVLPLPGWLLDALAAAGKVPDQPPLTRPRTLPGRPVPVLTDVASQRRHRYLLAAVAAELQSVLDAQPGTRNDTVNRAAFALGQLVAGAGLDEQAVTDALLTAALTVGLGEREALHTIASGLGSGAQSPRSASA